MTTKPNALSGSPIHPADDVIPITAGAGALTDAATGLTYVARALLCDVAGTATIVTPRGNTRTAVPLAAGWNPIGAREVTATTVTSLWGVPL